MAILMEMIIWQAAIVLNDKNIPVQTVIVGVVDEVDIPKS